MDSNSVSPMPELAPIAEFDKSPPSPPNEEVPMDDLPPPPATISGQTDGKKLKISSSGSESLNDSFQILSTPELLTPTKSGRIERLVIAVTLTRSAFTLGSDRIGSDLITFGRALSESNSVEQAQLLAGRIKE
ncbi:hypothetical protein MSG28_003341 [Choristoneura fumiferana]|uniref:Uncharacterized protein n=1 Tax=Choristoneura fumiferana TaxID=7141 RepID=A0ACC0KF45_CHOFU|nr:hypothetical protein MSG28_003341 [Choristoneura fumiferana]